MDLSLSLIITSSPKVTLTVSRTLAIICTLYESVYCTLIMSLFENTRYYITLYNHVLFAYKYSFLSLHLVTVSTSHQPTSFPTKSVRL
ncbi:hypothetical protein EB796_003856 [Bugula neritina]|uniref:Uncharacterized protein n=1 Tax=Bugula neritina TaxID=10212 RepID=A0A7J7KIS6_BUGNE|nr:hypothetical protein EB796_003856 [Bugula neritina]